MHTSAHPLAHSLFTGLQESLDAEVAVEVDNLGAFVPIVSPKFVDPEHLAPIVEVLERADHEPVRAIFTTPPRVGKTEILLHDIARSIKRRRTLQAGYASYSSSQATSKATRVHMYMERLRIRPDRRRATATEWRTTAGGFLLAAGMAGGFTGQGLHRLYIDDPLKNVAEAFSSRIRDLQWREFEDTLETRMEPGGSIFLTMTRWHEDDLAGRLIKERGLKSEGGEWEVIRIPALPDFLDERGRPGGRDLIGREPGQSIWPDRFSADHYLDLRRKKPLTFTAMYQGLPRAREERLFADTRFYDVATLTDGLTRAAGADLAFTAKDSGDWTVFVLMAKRGSRYLVLYAERWRRDMAYTKRRLKTLSKSLKVRITSEANGPQKGIVRLLEDEGIPIDRFNPRDGGDKYARAQPYADDWQAGNVLIPGQRNEFGILVSADVPWLEWFVEDHLNFTGHNDVSDDTVDASVMVHNSLSSGVSVLPVGTQAS